MWEKEFGQLGLNDNEREVYLVVLKAGKIAPHRVAAETGINRTTVYSIAKKLAKAGLISEDLGSKVAYLTAEPPEALTTLFSREERVLQERKLVAENLATELKTLPRHQRYSVPKMRFIEESDLNDFLYKQYAFWSESGRRNDNTWWGYHDSTFTESYEEWIDWTWKQDSEGLKVRFFTNEAYVEESMGRRHPDRETRILTQEEQFDSSMWVIGDYVITVQSRQRPHYLVEICDAIFARNQRMLFQNLWRISGPNQVAS